MNPSLPEHSWDSKWNQTSNIAVRPGYTYEITGWGEDNYISY